MATQLQIRRGTTAQMGAFTGAEGELAVNTSTDTVHVHDGATAGGFALAKADGSNIGTYAGSFTTLAASGASTLTGAVGINIAPTSYKLTVNSGATTETTAAAIGYNGDAGTNLYINTDHGNNLVSLYASGDVSKAMRFLSGTLEVMRLDTLGNVGIGGIASNSSGYTTLNLNNATNGGLFTFQNNGTAKGYIYNSSSQFRIESATSTPLVFANQTGETMRIDSAGNVGIGVSSPSDYYANNLVVGAGSEGGITIASSATTYNNYLAFADSSSGVARYAGLISYDHNINDMHFRTNSLERMRITSAGNVGIGTTSPTSRLQLDGAEDRTGGLTLSAGGQNHTYFLSSDFVNVHNIETSSGAAAHTWQTNGTERMRIDGAGNLALMTDGAEIKLYYTEPRKFISNSGPSVTIKQIDNDVNNAYIDFASWTNSSLMRLMNSGNLLVGTTSAAQDSGAGVKLITGTNGRVFVQGASQTSGQGYSLHANGAYRFYVNYSGAIASTSTSITGISDVSLKENIRDLDKGLETILALQPRRFDWKNGDGNDIMGFVAQEVKTVLPELVHDYKYNDEETKLGLKMGDMVPSLVKAIQEQQATIESQAAAITDLTTRLTALENT